MRQFTVENKTYTISEEEYQKLLGRFDTSKVTLGDHGGVYCIEAPCICPGKSVSYCPMCSLGPRFIECINILRSTSLRSCLTYLGLTYYKVTWSAKIDAKVRPKLDRLRRKLLELPELPE